MIEDYTNNLLAIITQLKNEEDLKNFFEEILSENEIKDIITRWVILNEIKKNTPYRKIAKEYNTSLAKINKYSNLLRKDKGFIRQILDKRYDETKL